MSDIEPSKLKVVALRAELQARGLDARGNKAVLVQRLEEALESEEKDNGEKAPGELGTENYTVGSELAKEKGDGDTTNTETKNISVDQYDDDDESEQGSLSEIPANDSILPSKETPEIDEQVVIPVDHSHETDSNVPMIEEEKPITPVAVTSSSAPEETMSVETDFSQNQPFIKQEKKQEDETLVDSASRRGEKRKYPEVDEKIVPQEQVKKEPVDEDTTVVLDSYNSDLNLTILPGQYSAEPLTKEGFSLMWAGVRSTFGVSSRKVCYEVKVLKHLDVSDLPEDEINPHVVRIGFSCDEASLLLGEEALSWGYGGTGKASTTLKFKDYGVPFAEGDVVTAFLDMGANKVDISFAKNGRHLGSAYSFPRNVIGDKALFPHILTKNSSFEVNFGQRENPYFELPPSQQDYVFIDCVPLDQRVRGTTGPKKKGDCEMIMMCGLPGSGKTTWANEYSMKHLHLKYNILGSNNIIDKMKVMGLPRKRNYAGRWEVLIQMSTKCLNTMMAHGSKLCRNYILDQTNVYPSAQRRKMRSFEDFKRRAVIIVPSDEEFHKRVEKREREEGKDVPDSAVLEMKANFGLPEVGQLFDAVEFTELQREEAAELVKKYNDEGQAALGPRRRFFNQDSKQGSGRWEPANQTKPSHGGGGFQGSPRDDFRGPPRDDFRGPPRDDFRGPPRDDFRGPPRDREPFRGRSDGDNYRGRGGGGFRGGRGGDARPRNDSNWQNSRWERNDSPGGRGGWRGGGSRGGGDRGGDRSRGWAPRRGGGDTGGRDRGWSRSSRGGGGGRGGYQDRGGGGYSRGGGGGGRGSFNNRGSARSGPPSRGSGGRGYNSSPPSRMDNKGGHSSFQQWDFSSNSNNQAYGQNSYQQYGQWKSEANSDGGWRQSDGAGGNWKQDPGTGQWKQDTGTAASSAYSQSYGQSYGTTAPAATDYTQQASVPYTQAYTYGQQTAAAAAYSTQAQYSQPATQQYVQQASVQQYTSQPAATAQQYSQAAAATTQQYAQTATPAQQQWAQTYQQQPGYQSYSQYGYASQ